MISFVRLALSICAIGLKKERDRLNILELSIHIKTLGPFTRSLQPFKEF